MTQFETELINAIRAGCPKCEHTVFVVTYLMECYDEVHLGYHVDEMVWNFGESGDLDSYTKVDCPNCSATLWTSDDGWILELADVVKGE